MEPEYYYDIPFASHHDDAANTDDHSASLKGSLWDYVAPDDDLAMAEQAELYEDSFSEMQELQLLDDDTPQRVQEFLKQHRCCRYSSPIGNNTQSQDFYEDALFLADVTDSAPIVPFTEYLPSFRTMSRTQLRSYCTFRSNFRKGVHLDVPSSYLDLLANELVLRIGTKDAEDAYQQLCELRDTYTDANRYRHFNYRCTMWLKDFVVVWALKEHYTEVFADVIEDHKKTVALLSPNDYDDHAVAIALQNNSRYQFLDSSYGKRNGDEMEQTAARMVRHLDHGLRNTAKMSFYQRYIDHRETLSRALFMGLHYWEGIPELPRNTSVVIDSMLRFICLDGHWMQDGYHQVNSNTRSAELGYITHELERQVRIRLHNDHRLKQRSISIEAQLAIASAITDYMQALREASRSKIEVDLSKLASIRNDATLVRDALLTEEERTEAKNTATLIDPPPLTPLTISKPSETSLDPISPVPAIPADIPTPSVPLVSATPAPSAPPTSPLSPDETTYLTLLLAGKDTASFLKEHRLMESILTESINDKLYDIIGDIVLEDGNHGLHIIEDYRPSLLSLLP